MVGENQQVCLFCVMCMAHHCVCYYIEIITNWIIVDKDNKPHYQAIFNADKMLSGVCALLIGYC